MLTKKYFIEDSAIKGELEVIIARTKDCYYNVSIKNCSTGRKITAKYKNFDDLILKHIILTENYILLKEKFEKSREGRW